MANPADLVRSNGKGKSLPSPGTAVVNGASNSTPNGVPNGNRPSESSVDSRPKRKQWVLHDGPHGSLQRLRLRMAEEGCGHSQVALAKQFLSENSGESDQIAIHWLIKAADQGHYEGLELLKTCFESNRGITEHNCHKIRSFLEMSQHERAARLGAKSLFASMAQGSDFVTTRQLEQWLEESFAKSRMSEEAEKASQQSVDGTDGESASSSLVLGELISEQHLISAASVYASGHFPPLLRLLNLGAKQKISYFCHLMTHTVLNLFTYPLSLSLMFSLVILFTALNNPFQVLLNLHITSVIFLLSWVLTLAAAAVFTAQTVRLIREWNVFHGWSNLLSQHAQQLLEPAVPEQLYIGRTFPPQLGRLLLAAVPCVSLQPALQLVRSAALPGQPGLWLPFGELSVMASLLCSACLDCRFGLGLDDLLFLVGWTFWRSQASPWSSFMDDDTESVEDFGKFEILHPALSVRFHLMGILGFLILVPLYTRRLRQFTHVRHFLAWCLPHFASLIWLFLAIDWLRLSSYDGVLRGLILSVVAVLLRSNCNWLTKANLLLCCVTSYSSGSAVGLTPWIALGVAVSTIAAGRMSAQLLTLTSQRYRLSELLRSFFNRRPFLYLWTVIRSSILIAFLSILALRLMNYVETYSSEETDAANYPISAVQSTGGRLVDADNDLLGILASDVNGDLSWDRYRHYCTHPLPSPGSASTIAATQLACSALNGIHVQWEGAVRQVSIDNRYNWLDSFLQWFPSKWADWFACRIGDKWPSCQMSDSIHSFEAKRCALLRLINHHRGRHCHLDRYSKFSLRLEVEPKLPNETLLSSLFDSKVTIELLVGSQFQSVGLRLTPGHVIRFQGTLSSPSLGALKTVVEVTSLECMSCQADKIDPDQDMHDGTQRSEDSFHQQQHPAIESVWPDAATFAASALQGTADFILPHFIRLNVTQLIWS